MGKTVQPTSKFALRKCDKTHNYLQDRISQLPSEIVVSILSLLTMKEAARTSALSRKWRYLWTFITGSLDFDDSEMVDGMHMGVVDKSLEVERRRFVDWVNQVLKSHQAPTLDGFRVCFDVDDKGSNCDIDSWINFAIEKRVKWLELDFTSARLCVFRWNYMLTSEFFSNFRFDSLTALRLTYVDVTGEVLECLLSNCPFLEVLCVRASVCLVDLKISGPSLKLKYLEIVCCSPLKNIEISAINLVSFKYRGPRISMTIKDVPRLVEVSFGGYYGCFLVNNFCQLSSYISQLETLKLDLENESFASFPKFPELRNLKQLELTLDASGGHSLLHCTSLLEASPLLNRFALKFTLLIASKQDYVKVWKAKCPHQCLKVVELVGFVGCKIDMEIALYVLENAVSLEKIIIDPRSPYVVGSRWDSNPLMKLAARTRARQLETRLPPGVELVIL